jgi:hypothetical protein
MPAIALAKKGDLRIVILGRTYQGSARSMTHTKTPPLIENLPGVILKWMAALLVGAADGKRDFGSRSRAADGR